MNKGVLGICFVMLMIATLGCGTVSVPVLNVGSLQEDNQTVSADGATSADVQLLMGTGELNVSPNADGLMQGTFRYNVAEWKPTVERTDVGNMASVLVQQGRDKDKWGVAGSGARNEWDIRLGNSVPMRLTVGVGAGTSKLEMGGLRLSRLSVESGAGDMALAFSAPNPEPLSHVEINCGAGAIEVRSGGNANFERLNIKGGAGQVTLDLNGAWTRSASVEVISGVGQVTVRVPREIGVQVKTGPSPVGKLIIEGLTATDGGYANELYTTASIKLDISLTTGVGQVTVTTR